MIFVHDKGRMANNMLQYGHVYAWGREHGRKTMSMRFAYKYPWFHICDTRYHHFLTYVFAKYAAKWGIIPTVSFEEEDTDYSQAEQQMLTKKMLMVTGWYAHWYELFLKYKSEILNLFAFKENVTKSVDARLNEMPAADLWLGVHIRRGDYRTWNNGKYFYSDEQYLHCIRQFLALHPDQRIVVFICGNDNALDKEKFIRELAGTIVIFPAGNPAEDMYLLSRCHYLIGPPSTFTLVASMYRNVPLYWIMDVEKPLQEDCFDSFDHLFRHIL